MPDSSSGFDFDKAFDSESAPQRLVVPVKSAARAQEVRSSRTRSSSLGSPRRGQGLSWTALLLAVAGALGAGLAMYQGITEIHLSSRPFQDFSWWMTVVVCSICGALIALTAGIWAVVRARPRTVAALAMVASVLLPTISLTLSTKFGIDALTSHLSAQAASLGVTVSRALQDTMTENNIETNPWIDFLFRLLG